MFKSTQSLFYRNRCLIVVFTALGLLFASTVKADSGLKPVTLQLQWHHQFQFAGYYAALAKGFYEEAGLEVTIKDGGYDNNGRAILPEAEVLFNRAQFGSTRTDLLINHSQGVPFVVLANIMQHSPFIFLTTDQFNFKRLEDIGTQRPISLNLPGSGDQRIDAEAIAALKVAGVNLTKLNNHFPTWELDDLLAGHTQLAPAYSTDEPYFVKKAGQIPVVIQPRDYGIDFYGDLLFTRQSMLDKQPEIVKKFRTASIKGWKYAMEHTDEIAELILKNYATRNEAYDKDFLIYEAEKIKELMNSDVIEIGYINKERWQKIAEIYQSLGLISDVNLDSFLYNPEPVNQWESYKHWLQLLIIPFLIAAGIIWYLFSLTMALKREILKRQEAEKTLKNQAELDSLTGISNRYVFQQNLEKEFARARRYQQPFSLMIMDIDLFKEVNDNYGHQAGDEVLRSLARVTKDLLRNSDLFARYGGEEFVVLLPSTSLSETLYLAKRILHTNRHNAVVYNDLNIRYTISIGVTEILDSDTTVEDVFKRSDDLLYDAKDAGRDCIRLGSASSA
ncbi:GGDEF domain-containing protein [Neptunomonas qingdaonensis]|uniref:diguanylate cyclase n=1 Tax=Neptunomonas qingdaonensis TaxID=1045558 RepID=A0A1I2R186_9GAMM|nr:GGDEF domain-containing protein [Neptunomonas qingdaonensis]SFG31636.1 diguanylate cyclase (GGDEF) domain-containing protein [Neptunomonas qingdaonensis]